MECPKCQFENPENMQFCGRCGNKLQNLCPSCEFANPPEFQFCGKCGTKLTQDAVPGVAVPKLEDVHAQLQRSMPQPLASKLQSVTDTIEGENRILSILFGDISGSVPIAERMSPEDAAKLINECLEVMVDIILKHEGSINRFLGDCVLAFFGTPVTRENDPERAILAALEMREAIGKLNLDISIGINTGMVYVGKMGTEAHQEFTAMGTAVNLASRLQGAAQPGQILVGEATYRLTRRAFAFNPLPPLTLRGITKPVSAYEILRILPKPEKIRGIEGLKAEMIGREREFADLKKCTDDLLAGRGQIVSIIGEAGVGKSRLVTELKTYLSESANQKQGDKENHHSPLTIHHSPTWLEGRCVSIGESTGYCVFIDILKSYLEFSQEDGPKELGEKIVAKMKALFPPACRAIGADRQGWEDIVPYIGNLLSVKFGNEWDDRVKYLPAEQVKYQTFLTLRDVFVALAQQKPLLLILEDLHWADNLSLDLLTLLMDVLTTTPLMLLCIYRPDKEHKSWRIGTQASGKCLDRYKEIKLRPLSPQESRRLVESLLSIENLPQAVRESILQKAEGNPFFVEEVIRSLIESGVVYRDGSRWVAKEEVKEISVPDTIQNVIMARIDRLDDEARYVLQSAAVIGRLFRHKLLQYATQQEQNLDRYLWQLEESDLVYEERAIPELEYSFKHVLTQETVYRNLLSHHQQALHQKVGDGIERLYQDRIEAFYEELAWHYSQSGYLPKAIDYLLKAGEKAKGMYVNQEAIGYFERALEFIQSQPTGEERISLEITTSEALGDVLFTTGAHTEAEIQLNHALSLASRQQDVQHLAALTWKLADLKHWQGELDSAIEMVKSGLTALGEQIHCPEAANLLEVITRSYWAKGDLESARRYANQNAQVIRKIPYFDSIYKIYYSLAWVEMHGGNFQAVSNWLEEMEHICLEHNNEVGLARCYHGLGDLCAWYQNDLQQASQWLEKSLNYCERTGETHLLLEGYLELAHHLILLGGNPDTIEKHIQKGLEIANQMAGTSKVASVPGLCTILVDAYLEKGNIEQALLYFHHAIESGASTSTLIFLLRRLEQFYVQRGRREAFFDFCQQMQQQMSSQSQISLRYWHLQPGVPSTDYSQLTWWDSFEGASLCEEWDWIDPQGESSYHLDTERGILELRTSTRNLSPPNPSIPRLLREISGDFAIQARLVDITEKECQIGGLLLWASEDMYLNFGKMMYLSFGARPTLINDLRLEACQQSQHEIIGRGWLQENQLYLRLERRGKSVSAFCSDDGRQWQSCGEATFFADDPLWVGLYVGCPARLPDSVVRFKEFNLFQRVEHPENRGGEMI